MSQTIDTNVLLYASNADAPEQSRAAALLAHLAAGPGLVHLLWPTVMSYLRIATHPRVFDRPLSPATAVANIEALQGLPHVRTVGEGAGFWATYSEVTRQTLPRGNLVPDAHLVALMIEHGIGTIWSRDRDLRKFDGIIVKDPFDARYAGGFTTRRRG